MIDNYIYLIIVDGNIWPEYGYFVNFDEAKAKAANIAAEYGGIDHINEESWKSSRLFIASDHVVGVVKVDHFTCAEY